MEDCTVTTETIDEIQHTYYRKNGIVVAECRKSVDDWWYTIEQWYRGDKLHREDKAALTCYEGGDIIEEGWFRDGKQHRDDGPAAIYYEFGQITRRYWYRDDKPHRDDGPAEIWHECGQLTKERWYHNGKIHRDDGPAEIWYKYGQIIDECWYRNGKLCPIGRLASVVYRDINSVYCYYTGVTSTQNIDEFRDAVKGDAIHDALRPLPIPIRDAIIPHYCYQ